MAHFMWSHHRDMMTLSSVADTAITPVICGVDLRTCISQLIYYKVIFPEI